MAWELYIGHTDANGARWCQRQRGEKVELLEMRDPPPDAREDLDFDWGNWTDGAEWLARALLRDAIGFDALTDCAARAFALDVIAHLPRHWCMTRESIREWFLRATRWELTMPPVSAPEGTADA